MTDCNQMTILGHLWKVSLQFVDFPGFRRNSFDSLAILGGFAIPSQFNLIVQDREWIALNLQSNYNPLYCKRLCQGFGNLVAIQFDRVDCDQNRAILG